MTLGHIEARLFVSRGWEIDLAKRELRAHGSAIPIGSRAFEIIETLVQSAGELVTKDDLMRRVWPGLVVEDNTVQVHISAIRKALGPDRGLLKTISGRGYRLLGDWTTQPDAMRGSADAGSPARLAMHPYVTNLPVAAAPLVGRESAVQQLRDLVSAYRVVTLTGPGGIGKTVLACEVARRLVPTLAGDALFVELVSLSDPDLVASAVAQVLGLHLHGDEISPDAVVRAIGERAVLLVLDNCEHVIDAAATMAEALVQSCPNVSVLATSRELLRVEGEFAYRVPALAVPTLDHESQGDILEHSAAQLFVARTRALRADFLPEGDKLPAIAAICRQLDGIPLAIEFAAARAATLGIQQVAGRLDDRFALLMGGRRTALPRHQTLRATLDWSYELLPDSERRLLRHLATFTAGFCLDAASVVSDETETAAAFGISSLVLKSLVAMDGTETAPRWRLLETVRLYALEKLVDSGEHPAAMRRLAQFCLAMLSSFARDGGLDGAIDELAPYRREIDNLRAALTWTFSAGGDNALGVELAAAASDLWVALSLVAEAGEWAETALSRIGEAAGTRPDMILRCGLGFALIYTEGMSPRAREILTTALGLARQLGDFDYQQRATCGLWLFSARSMALNDALAFARDYEAVARDRDLQAQATAAWMVGIPQTYMAMHVEASERLAWAVRHFAGQGRRDMMRLGADLRTSALAHDTVNLVSRGFADQATRMAARAVEEARRTGQPFVLCVALAWAAGFVSLSLGTLDQARAYGDELVHHAFKHGLHPFHAAGLCVRGSLASKLGDATAGTALLRQGLAAMHEAKYLLFYPFFLAELAASLGKVGRHDEAIATLGQAAGVANETGYRWYAPEIARLEADLLLQGGAADLALVEALLRQAMGRAAGQQALYWELSSATGLAALLHRQARDDEALALLRPIYNRFTEGFRASKLVEAKALLDRLALST